MTHHVDFIYDQAEISVKVDDSEIYADEYVGHWYLERWFRLIEVAARKINFAVIGTPKEIMVNQIVMAQNGVQTFGEKLDLPITVKVHNFKGESEDVLLVG